MKDLPQDMEDMKKLPRFIMACYHGHQTMDCGMIVPKLCPWLEHISLTFENISDSLGEATQFESRETLFCKENNMKLHLQQLFRKLGNWNHGGANGDEEEEPQPSKEDPCGNWA